MMGRPAIFHGKRHRVQGFVTPVAKVRIEQARRRLANKVGWKPSAVSMADVYEYLARGDADTDRYLAKHRPA